MSLRIVRDSLNQLTLLELMFQQYLGDDAHYEQENIAAEIEKRAPSDEEWQRNIQKLEKLIEENEDIAKKPLSIAEKLLYFFMPFHLHWPNMFLQMQSNNHFEEWKLAGAERKIGGYNIFSVLGVLFYLLVLLLILFI